MVYKATALTIILLLLATLLWAQFRSTYAAGINGQVGFIIPHSSELKEISKSNPWGLAIDFSKLMTSEKAWQGCNCFSKNSRSHRRIHGYQNVIQLLALLQNLIWRRS